MGVVARSGESGRGRGRGGDDDIAFGLQEGDDRLLTVHALLGVAILMPALTRLAWRRFTPLPPWTEALSPLERKVATWTERALYLCLVLIPLTGISLVLVDDDLLPLHVGAQMHRRTIRPRKNR